MPSCPHLVMRSLFKLAPVSSDVSPSLFEHFITLKYMELFQSHLVLSLSQPWNEPFLQGAMVPFSGRWYLEVNISRNICSLLLGCCFTQIYDRPRKYIYVYIRMHTSIHVCACMCV